MNRLIKLQFVGPFALFVATLCAELASRALQNNPTSELLWFINLRVFGIFQRSHASLSYFVPIDGFQFLGVALPIFALACIGLAAKSRVAFTVATHLSAGYAGFLILAWQLGVPAVKQASLVTMAIPKGVGLYMTAAILGSCLLSFAVTHVLYLLTVRNEIRDLVRRLSKVRRSGTRQSKDQVQIGQAMSSSDLPA
ncbi:hypothetical protein JQ617_37965 [Bradyrhizobium sp. KB893862 SZCCT0404]|uniref:hypothetical protein n=1 Tax=Bradyrhizobium sp. KB893862 SZCCT0404 TaxID=2807672 RepID=UPI001BA8C375|nr:hypothetical protein [Bradyrhizobium sp. KB893862 SZCCT0404]MBR1179805.1 hypothetical protein [Bradyrhizobium sp. KB893862 SZCCT0404]